MTVYVTIFHLLFVDFYILRKPTYVTYVIKIFVNWWNLSVEQSWFIALFQKKNPRLFPGFPGHISWKSQVILSRLSISLISKFSDSAYRRRIFLEIMIWICRKLQNYSCQQCHKRKCNKWRNGCRKMKKIKGYYQVNFLIPGYFQVFQNAMNHDNNI